MTLEAIGLCGAGLAVLVAGAELLVRGASRLAIAVGVSPLIIGLTVVAYGTSAPEFAVSVQTALAGQPDISLGNVVGGNLFNTLGILGVCALLLPLVVRQQLVWLDVPVMIAASAALYLLALDGHISRLEGVGLIAVGVAYVRFSIRQSRKEPDQVQEEYVQAFGAGASGRGGGLLFRQGLLILVGLVLLVAGADWMSAGAVAIARGFGVSELVIGLTLVGVGTSLPELTTSVVATLHGKQDIAVGNVVGSNIFRIFGVVGAAGLAAPYGLSVAPALTRFDLPVMLATAVACLPIFFTGHQISRWEGGVFLSYYVAYVCYLLLEASHHDLLPAFSLLMLAFVIPLTLLTLAVVAARSLKR